MAESDRLVWRRNESAQGESVILLDADAGVEFKALKIFVTWNRDTDVDFLAKLLFFIKSLLSR